MNINKYFSKLALLFVAIAWGSSAVVIKSSTDTLPAGTLLAWRFTLAFLFLVTFNLKKLKMIDKSYWKSGFLIGLCLFLACFTQTIGVMLEMPGKSLFLSSAYCVFVPFLTWLLLKKRPKITHIIAAFLCTAGIILVSTEGGFYISFGDSISIISSIFWALQIVTIAKYSKEKDPSLITLLQFAVCMVLAWGYSFLFENPISVTWKCDTILSVLYLGFVCSGLCFFLQTAAQKIENPTNTAIILSFENIIGLIFGALLFNEKFTTRSIIGFILMFTAIIVAENLGTTKSVPPA